MTERQQKAQRVLTGVCAQGTLFRGWHQVHMAQPASAIDLDPGISLNPGPQVGFLCLLEYPSAVLTSGVESVLLEGCRMD